MKNILSLLLLSALLLFTTATAKPKQVVSIIPVPAKMEIGKGEFKFNSSTKILIDDSGAEFQKLGDLLITAIYNATGLKLAAPSAHGNKSGDNLISIQNDKNISDSEAYSLEINPKKITISASGGAGIFYAIQSLLQLMPVEGKQKNFSVPALSIQDSPRFKWRGMHLDVCRHFFPVEFIKKYIDILAFYKINRFHWHLTDDQGWRIEIKKYPKLTEAGSWRKETAGDGKPYGGFYTQEQIKEVIRYAQERYVTVMPEIEMPGHALAALTAYPELSCTGGSFETGTTWGVFEDVFCAGNNKTFSFLEDVLTEVMNLFPSEYIHIGGDECPKERWKVCPKCQTRIKAENLKDEFHLQSYFIQRIEKFINSKGRKIIGWDEILEGGLAPNAAVMSWRGIDGGIAAAKSNHNVAMSPGTHCYFDHYQGLNGEPKAIGGYTNLEKVYSYEPVPEVLNADEAKYIMGAQANLWTEYIETTDHVEYMLLPRLLALSEVVWSPKSSRNYEDFSSRIMKHYDILQKKNYNFRVPTPLDETGEYLLMNRKPIEFLKPVKESKIFYTLDGTEPTEKSKLYTSPLKISKAALLKARTFLNNGRTSPTVSLLISVVDTTKNGLNYKYYEGNWDKLPDFSALTPVKSGKVYKLSLRDFKPREDGFGLVISGFIKIDKPGEYNFYLNSDDGSKFSIDDKLLIDNDGPHSSRTASAKTDLAAGKHKVEILFFEGAGSQNLSLEFEGAGVKRMPVPASAFFRN